MIYLDNCATTKMRKEILDLLIESLKEDFGNPSSLHKLGLGVEKKLKIAREQIANFMSVNSKDIYFTSGGTESNNLAINASLKKMRSKGKHLITSKIEHPSVLNVFKNLEQMGYRVSYISVDKDGIINMEELKSEISQDTVLVSIMHVNNEIGSIQPIEEIGRILKDKDILFHVDGVQGFGKVKLNLINNYIDLYSFSGHKVYGPKGVGGLYINGELKLEPTIFGGNQEKGFRSGTENAPSLIAMGKAIEIMDYNFTDEQEHIKDINKYFRKRLEEIDDIKINTNVKKSSPYIINVSINNIRGEVLVHYLELKDIFISTSSACSSNDTKKSHVLQSIRLSNKEIEGSIRICFSYETTKKDVDKAIDTIKESVGEIREIIMR